MPEHVLLISDVIFTYHKLESPKRRRREKREKSFVIFEVAVVFSVFDFLNVCSTFHYFFEGGMASPFPGYIVKANLPQARDVCEPEIERRKLGRNLSSQRRHSKQKEKFEVF